VIGIPLTEQNFQRKLKIGNDGNFASSFAAGVSEQLAWAAYQRVAELVERIASESESLGVTVMRTALLAHLTRATKVFKVVTVVSQWRSALFKETDVRQPDRLFQALQCENSNTSAVLRSFCPDFQFRGAGSISSIVEALNRAISTGLSFDQNQLGARTQAEATLMQRRAAVEETIPAALVGGPGVEFDDQFHSIVEVVRAIDESFSGVLDLTICNSVMLAQAAHEKCAEALVLCNEQVTYADFRLPLYLAVIRFLARRPQPYEDANYRVREGLLRGIK